MIVLKRTNAEDVDFKQLVASLDMDLKIRDGEEHVFYDQYNKIDAIKYVVIAYSDERPVGCGAVKEFDKTAMEIKRMYVQPDVRGKGIASQVLKALEEWTVQLGYTKCYLETGKKQPEAIALYTKNGYNVMPNFGQYENVENSICFAKKLLKS